jgi:hypothetical protein
MTATMEVVVTVPLVPSWWMMIADESRFRELKMFTVLIDSAAWHKL